MNRKTKLVFRFCLTSAPYELPVQQIKNVKIDDAPEVDCGRFIQDLFELGYVFDKQNTDLEEETRIDATVRDFTNSQREAETVDGFNSSIVTSLAAPLPAWPNRPNAIECDVCGLRFGRPCELQNHKKTHAPAYSPPKSGSRAQRRCIACPHCTKTFSRRCNVNRHVKKAHERTGLGLSDKPKQSKKDLLVAPSNRIREFRCDKCTQIFDRKQCLTNHRKTHDKVAKVKHDHRKCEKSSSIYSSKNSFQGVKCSRSSPSTRIILEPEPDLEQELNVEVEPNTDTRESRVCNGFTLRFPTVNQSIVRPADKVAGNVWKSVNCSSENCVERGGTCCAACHEAKAAAIAVAKSLHEKSLLCNGVNRQTYEVLIEAREWDGRRRSVSLASFYGARLFSMKCDGSKTTTNLNRCDLCDRMRRTLKRSKNGERQFSKGAKKVNEMNRILFAQSKYLTDTEKSLKERLRREKNRSKKRLIIETVFGQSGLVQSEANLMNTEDIEKELAIREKVSEKKIRQQRTKAVINKSIKRLNNRLAMYNPLIAKAIDFEKRLRFQNQLAKGIDQDPSALDVDNGNQEGYLPIITIE